MTFRLFIGKVQDYMGKGEDIFILLVYKKRYRLETVLAEKT